MSKPMAHVAAERNSNNANETDEVDDDMDYADKLYEYNGANLLNEKLTLKYRRFKPFNEFQLAVFNINKKLFSSHILPYVVYSRIRRGHAKLLNGQPASRTEIDPNIRYGDRYKIDNDDDELLRDVLPYNGIDAVWTISEDFAYLPAIPKRMSFGLMVLPSAIDSLYDLPIMMTNTYHNGVVNGKEPQFLPGFGHSRKRSRTDAGGAGINSHKRPRTDASSGGVSFDDDDDDDNNSDDDSNLGSPNNQPWHTNFIDGATCKKIPNINRNNDSGGDRVNGAGINSGHHIPNGNIYNEQSGGSVGGSEDIINGTDPGVLRSKLPGAGSSSRHSSQKFKVSGNNSSVSSGSGSGGGTGGSGSNNSSDSSGRNGNNNPGASSSASRDDVESNKKSSQGDDDDDDNEDDVIGVPDISDDSSGDDNKNDDIEDKNKGPSTEDKISFEVIVDMIDSKNLMYENIVPLASQIHLDSPIFQMLKYEAQRYTNTADSNTIAMLIAGGLRNHFTGTHATRSNIVTFVVAAAAFARIIQNSFDEEAFLESLRLLRDIVIANKKL